LQDLERTLLNLKKTILIKNPDDSNYIIYNFATPYVKGFQFGSLASNNKAIDIYDNDNNSYYLIVKKSTQSEVDYILSTLKTN